MTGAIRRLAYPPASELTAQLASGAAIFFDKDGTLIDDLPFNVAPENIRLSKHAGAALRLLRKQGYALFVVSNQSGIGLGLFDESALCAVREKIDAPLQAEDVWLDGFYYCPHWKDGPVARYATACDCRKPAPGMLSLAARQHDLSLSQSWMVGDILDDVEAGLTREHRRPRCGLCGPGSGRYRRKGRLVAAASGRKRCLAPLSCAALVIDGGQAGGLPAHAAGIFR